jgi:argininosuccinate synthase
MTRLARRPTLRRIVLAYTGSATTTVAIRWLADRYGAEVVTLTLDLGQGAGLETVRDRALAAGARRAHVVDAREEFARDFIVPALCAGAVRGDGDPLLTALSRPVIARHLVEVATIEDADALAHGCSGHEPDARRFETLLHALRPALTVLAPARDWRLTPVELARRARQYGLAVSAPGACDVHHNLWGRTAEPGPAAVNDTAAAAAGDREVYVLTRSPSAAPDLPANVEVSFQEGVPVAVNGVALPLVELISSVQTIAGTHGVGRIAASPAPDGARPLTIEAPAATVLHEAHRALQRSVVPPDLADSAREREATYVDLVATGGWFSAEREAGDAFVARVQKHVTGTARLKLFKGRSEVVECRSPFALRVPASPPASEAVGSRS